MYDNKLIDKDLFRNYRHICGTPTSSSYIIGYTGDVEHGNNPIMTDVSDLELKLMEKTVSVQKIRPIATIRGEDEGLI